jgi:hypothetical protein
MSKDNLSFENLCSGYPTLPDVVPLSPGQQIVAIGDIHGDYTKLLGILKQVGVIDDDNHWIGGNTIVVQVGDQIDSCRPGELSCEHPDATPNDAPHDIKVLKFLTELHKKAIFEGGAVYSLFGNHEFLATQGRTRYVSKANLDFYGGVDKYKEAFKPGGEMAKFMGCTRLAAIIVGEYLFVHAGILPDVASKYSIEQINKLIRLYILNKLDEASFTEVIDLMNNSKTSPFWQRILGKIPSNVNLSDKVCSKYIKPVLKTYQIKGMVIGHTPQFILDNTANITCGGTLGRTDTGMSSAFDGFSKGAEKEFMRETPVLVIKNGEMKTLNEVMSKPTTSIDATEPGIMNNH